MTDLENIQKIQERVKSGILNSSWNFDYWEDGDQNSGYYEIGGNLQSKNGQWEVKIYSFFGHDASIIVKKNGETVYKVDSSDHEGNLRERLEVTKTIESCFTTWIRAKEELTSNLLDSMPT